MYSGIQASLCSVWLLAVVSFVTLNSNHHITVQNVRKDIVYNVIIRTILVWLVMKQGMGLIDCLISICLTWEAEFVQIGLVNLPFREFRDVSKYNAQDARNVCASNAQQLRWSPMIPLNKPTTIWIELMEAAFDIIYAYSSYTNLVYLYQIMKH